MPFYLIHAGSALQKVSTAGALMTLTLPPGVTLDPTKRARFAILNRQIVVTNAVSENIVVDPTDMAPSPLRTEILREPQRLWVSDLRPEIFGVLLVQPERMAALNLVQYIDHLAENYQQTSRYEIALWNKVFYPIAVLVMIALLKMAAVCVTLHSGFRGGFIFPLQ